MLVTFLINRIDDLMDITPPLVCTLALLFALTKALVYIEGIA